jgi:hypothetical protein
MVKVRELEKLEEQTKLCPMARVIYHAYPYLTLYRNYSFPWQAFWKCQTCDYEEKIDVEGDLEC